MLNDYDNTCFMFYFFNVAIFLCFEVLWNCVSCVSFPLQKGKRRRRKKEKTQQLWAKLLIWTDFPLASFEIATHTHIHTHEHKTNIELELKWKLV